VLKMNAAKVFRDLIPNENRMLFRKVGHTAFKMDLVLADKELNYFSTNPEYQLDGPSANADLINEKNPFELCSDRIARIMPTYDFDETGRAVLGPDSERVSFKWLKSVLSSTDLDLNNDLKWADEGEIRFLDGEEDLTGDRVSFSSWPRMGNTFLRSFLEKITGVFTGSDMDIKITWGEMQMGMLGNGHTSTGNNVWITKTHVPQTRAMGGGANPFECEKQICVVRNWIDAFPSYSTLIMTASHSMMPKNNNYHETHP